jgi:hypothetical protein
MKLVVQFDKDYEKELVFYDALCNGLGALRGYGIEIGYDLDLFRKAKENLSSSACYEDILIRILQDGGKLFSIDHESGEYDYSISIKDVHERIPLVPNHILMDYIQKRDDVDSADVVLQTVFFKEVIFA